MGGIIAVRCERDGSAKCGVLPLLIDYLYSGQDERAWAALSELYDGADNAPRRDLYWLQAQPARAGIGTEGEMLVLAPKACDDVCRLDVIHMSDNAPAGGVRLATETGLPGAVYRVNDPAGCTVERWRLQGELSWERAPR